MNSTWPIWRGWLVAGAIAMVGAVVVGPAPAAAQQKDHIWIGS